jgi:hypothetical protein
VREIEGPFRGAGCDQVFEQTLPSHPLPHRGGADRCSDREVLLRNLR